MDKEIQLVGIGNSLVDIQIEVSEEELKLIGLEKGTMTLVDTKFQDNTINLLGNRISNKSSGGSAANTIIAYSNFGGTAAYKSILGEDHLGHFYKDEFNKLGIVLDARLDKIERTGTCVVLITPDSERTMATSLGANLTQNKNDVNQELISKSLWLYIEGYKFSEQGGYEAIEKAVDIAKNSNTKIALTLSDKFVVDVFEDKVNNIAAVADLIFCNDLEARTFTHSHNNEDAFKILSDRFENFVMTLGDKGSYVRWNGENIKIPAYKVNAIDSTGAGDIYAAGFLYGLINQKNPERAGHLGSLAASKVISQFGARLNQSHKDLRFEILGY